ncbi:MAG: hypothetical protein IJ353_02120 [Lachnospiraceae bacterium]|nr:hypothetical protein [Lachnospiraceae bacterium]
MEYLFIIILCGAVGLVLIGCALSDRSPGWIILFLIGAWFIALPVCLVNGWNKAFVLLITVPLGILWVAGAVSGLLEPFYYCIPADAEYEEYVFVGSSRRNHTRFYALKCKYHYGNRGYQEKSRDRYTQGSIEKKFSVGSTMQIWINKKNPKEFKAKRYHGMFAYSLLLVIGIGFLCIAGKVILLLV